MSDVEAERDHHRRHRNTEIRDYSDEPAHVLRAEYERNKHLSSSSSRGQDQKGKGKKEPQKAREPQKSQSSQKRKDRDEGDNIFDFED